MKNANKKGKHKKSNNEKNTKKGIDMYRVVFLTGPPDFQYQKKKQVAANQD